MLKAENNEGGQDDLYDDVITAPSEKAGSQPTSPVIKGPDMTSPSSHHRQVHSASHP